MVKFINSSQFKDAIEVSTTSIDNFITAINGYLNTGVEPNNGVYSINTAIVTLPRLNSREMKECVKLAKSEGWELGSYADNYQTTTYTMKPINFK